jgi:hypothetical protein
VVPAPGAPSGIGLLESGNSPPTVASGVFIELESVPALLGLGGKFTVDFMPGLCCCPASDGEPPPQADKPYSDIVAIITRADFIVGFLARSVCQRTDVMLEVCGARFVRSGGVVSAEVGSTEASGGAAATSCPPPGMPDVGCWAQAQTPRRATAMSKGEKLFMIF